MAAFLTAALAAGQVPGQGAGDAAPVQQPPAGHSPPGDALKVSPKASYSNRSVPLDVSDEIATLEAIRVALTEVGDGSSYVWYRGNGRLSGVIHPVSSFKDASGRVCRHIVLVLTTGLRSGRVEGAACRLPDGRWQLNG